MAKDVITSEELNNTVGVLATELTTLLDNKLGEAKYSCYVSVVWDQAVLGQEDSKQTMNLVYVPENDLGGPSIEEVTALTKALSSDPFLNHAIIYNFVNTILSNFVPADGSTVKSFGKFKNTTSMQGVN